MAEPFNVVAIIHPLPGKGPEIIEAFRQVAPLVHEEKGCELYALQLTQDEQKVIVIERWTTHEDLDAHSQGAPIQLLNELTGHLRAAPTDVILTDGIPMGDPVKGAIG